MPSRKKEKGQRQKAAHILLLSGGQGRRFSTKESKQFVQLGDKPVLLHSLLAFLAWPRTKSIVLVVAKQEYKKSRAHIEQYLRQDSPKLQLAIGAKTRHLSCLAGLQVLLRQCEREEPILIHDAARPLLKEEELERLWAAFFAAKPPIAIASLAHSLKDSIVQAASWLAPIEKVLDRGQSYAVKTPQMARAHTLEHMIAKTQRQEHALQKGRDFHDLLSWGQSCGVPGMLVEAHPHNHKLTRQEDLALLQKLALRPEQQPELQAFSP